MDFTTACERCKKDVDWTAAGICGKCVQELYSLSKKMKCGHSAAAADSEGACIVCSVEECSKDAVARAEEVERKWSEHSCEAVAGGALDAQEEVEKQLFALRKDKERLDWLEANSYAFVRRADTGKGFIRLSADYLHNHHPEYGLRKGIDDARAGGDVEETKDNQS